MADLKPKWVVYFCEKPIAVRRTPRAALRRAIILANEAADAADELGQKRTAVHLASMARWFQGALDSKTFDQHRFWGFSNADRSLGIRIKANE